MLGHLVPFVALVCGVMGHIKMIVPFNGGADLNPAQAMCHGSRGKHNEPLQAGGSLAVKLEGTASHNGGGCQFGLSYDNGNSFTLLMTTDVSCPIKLDWNVPIPAEAPSCDSCVFAWGWIPKSSGGPEYYMNCAEVQVIGKSGAMSAQGLSGKTMEFYNFGKFPRVHSDEDNQSGTKGLTKMFGEFTYGSRDTPGTFTTNQGNTVTPENGNGGSSNNKYPPPGIPFPTNQGTTVTPENGNGGSYKEPPPGTYTTNQGNTVAPENVNGGSSNNKEPTHIDTNNNSNSGSGDPCGSVYGDTTGVSSDELLQRAIRYQNCVIANQKVREAQQQRQQVEDLNRLIAGAGSK
jgi:hypothetical protein